MLDAVGSGAGEPGSEGSVGSVGSTAMRMVDRLIAAGLAVRHANPRNRRETLLRLTEEGRRTVAHVTARRRSEIAGIVELLTPAQRLALVEALAAFNHAEAEPPAPDLARPHPPGWSVDFPAAHDV